MGKPRPTYATVSIGDLPFRVALFSTVGEHRTRSGTNLHKDCWGEVKQPKQCGKCNDSGIEADRIQKGYRVEDKVAAFVTFDSSESSVLADAARGARAKAGLGADLKEFRVERFVTASTVHLSYFEKTYFVEPKERNAKSLDLIRYHMWRRVLESGGFAAFGASEIFGSEAYMLLVPMPDERGLLLHQLRFSDEIREQSPNFADLMTHKAVHAVEGEAKKARAIAASLRKKFDPDMLQDHTLEAHDNLFERKKGTGQLVGAQAQEWLATQSVSTS